MHKAEAEMDDELFSLGYSERRVISWFNEQERPRVPRNLSRTHRRVQITIASALPELRR